MVKIHHIALMMAISLIYYPSRSWSASDLDAEHVNTTVLLIAAGAASGSGEIEDAGFLFYAAQARYQIDKQVYPPVGKGGGGPGALKAALSFSIGQAIVPAVTGDPTAYANVIARLSKWSPKFETDYDPGWEYKNVLDKEVAAKVVATTCKAMLTPLKQKAKLLGREEYQLLTKELGAAHEVEQRYWAACKASRGVDSIADKLREEYLAAIAKRRVAAKRMFEIEWELNPDSRWHRMVKWSAEDYFDDPKTVKFCHAIERNDVDAMNRLIAAGANVNALGKEGMTLLLWAFPDRKLERFECLLEHGADPNVFFESDFGVGRRPFHPYPENKNLYDDRGCHAGQSVTHLACRSPVIEYMQQVFAHGGNANLVDKKTKEVPLDIALRFNMPHKRARVEILLREKADLNRKGSYPAIRVVKRHAYDVALLLLQSGADISRTQPKSTRTLVHWVLMHEEHLPFSDAKRASDYQALVDWLEEHEAPFDKARADLDRIGRLWGKSLKQKREKELAEGQALGRVIAKKRVEKLQAMKSADLETPESVADWVKTLDAEQLKRIELPTDLEAKVFVMYQRLFFEAQADEQLPWLTIYADGRIVCRSRASATADPVEARLGKSELTWLMHLTVNECKLLERNTADYVRKKRRTGKGFFKYQLAVKSGSNELQLSQDTLVVKSLRRKLGLESFKVLHTYVNGLANRAHLGDKAEVEKVLKAINDELQKKHPEMPYFHLHHLVLADRSDDSRFVCSLKRKIDLGDRQYEEVTATYVLEDKKPKITINVRKYRKG